jgi:hypothetical protein
MGLFSLPVRGLFKVFNEVADLAEKELYDEDAVKKELMELYQKLEAGAIDETEFERREGGLVQRLEAIEERQKTRGR